MKRTLLIAGTVLTLLISGAALYADGGTAQQPMGPGMMGQQYAQGAPGMMGHGMMGSGMMGSGMMGMMGPGMMGMGGTGMQGMLAQLPDEKREAMQSLYVETAQKMLTQHAAMQGQMIAMHQSMSQFPVNKEALSRQYDAMQTAHRAMFELMVDTSAKAQGILGAELWKSMQSGMMPSTGMGQGMMGR